MTHLDMTETKLNIPADCEVVIGLQAGRKTGNYFGTRNRIFGGLASGWLDGDLTSKNWTV